MVNMAMSLKLLLTSVVLLCSFAGQQSGEQPAVGMQYCGMKPGRPPLMYLSFHITVRNYADNAKWFLFPAALYDKPAGTRKDAGIDAVELFSDSEHKVTVVNFMGTMNLQPDGAGGFKGVLLPAGAVVSIHGFGISFWGEPVSPISIRVVIADRVTIGGPQVGEWLGKDLLSAKTADVKDLELSGSKSTDDHRELPVEIAKSGEIDVADVLAGKCPK